MSKVKGGKLDDFDIQVRSPGRIWGKRLILVVIVALISVASFYYGNYKGDTDKFEAQKNIDALGEQILNQANQNAQLNQKYEKLQEQYSHLELAANIDASQVEAFRLKDVEQFEEINELKAHLAFYQSIMSPSDMKKGLTIEQFEIVNDEGNTLKAILTQVTDKPLKIQGSFQVLISGVLSGQTKVYNLGQVSSSPESVRFGFKFFQRFSIDLTLPEGFVPQSVELVAKQTGNKNKAVSQIITWPSAN